MACGNKQTIIVFVTEAASNQKIKGASVTSSVTHASGKTQELLSGVINDTTDKYRIHGQ